MGHFWEGWKWHISWTFFGILKIIYYICINIFSPFLYGSGIFFIYRITIRREAGPLFIKTENPAFFQMRGYILFPLYSSLSIFEHQRLPFYAIAESAVVEHHVSVNYSHIHMVGECLAFERTPFAFAHNIFIFQSPCLF